MIPAIVLAAGKSERMGQPKALLPCRGRTFLEDILEAIAASPLAPAIVVLGHHHDEIRRAVDLPEPVYNPDYEQGMTSSLKAGIRVLPARAAGAMLFLVDHPGVRPSTIEALLAVFAPGRIVVPVYRERRGHPVLFARGVLDEILGLPDGVGANTVVRSRPDRVIAVGVDDPAVVADLDTPEDFRRWAQDRG